MRDPGNLPHTVHNLHICVRDMNAAPPNPAMARKMMSDAVGTTHQVENAATNVITVGDYDLRISGQCIVR